MYKVRLFFWRSICLLWFVLIINSCQIIDSLIVGGKQG